MRPAPGCPRPLAFALLRLLGDGEFRSGEAMAAELGVSRASVNNALAEVEAFGLTLYRVRGRGYRLLDPPQWLDRARIEYHLGGQGQAFKLALLDCASSSNTLLLRQMAEGAPSGSVLAVEWQSGGRGRLGRTWHSGMGNALTFSLLWRFDCGLGGLSGLSLGVGVALIRALRVLGIDSVGLKWPNDLLDQRGAKLAGVLIEAQGDVLGPSGAVIGVGLNLTLPQHVSEKIGRSATGLADMLGAAPDRNRLLAELLLQLAGMLRAFGGNGFRGLREEWEAYHAFQDRPVCLAMPDGSRVCGIARGVTEEGALKLETSGVVQAFHAGEVGPGGGGEYAVA